jgi:hypothetical protein
MSAALPLWSKFFKNQFVHVRCAPIVVKILQKPQIPL